MKNSLISLILVLCAVMPAFGQSTGKTYEFRNGLWFNGEGFTENTWFVVNGLLSKKAPETVDSIIDLSGHWVVPPFADANCFSIADNPNAENVLDFYMNEGVFYLQIIGNTQEGREAVSQMLENPIKPDATFSNGGITCSLGYPFLKYEGPANGIKNPANWGAEYDRLKLSQKSLGNGYWFIDNKDALNANWKKILAQKPDFISINLLDVANNGGKEGKGLSKEMAKMIVKKAHKSKLRVVAYAETANDLRLGISLKVDGFANLPGYNWDGTGDGSKYELKNDDLKKLAKKKIPVVTLFSHSQTVAGRKDAKEANAELLKKMFDSGVNIVMGSDDPQRTIRSELNYWYSLGVMDNLKVLKVLCENTPNAIYPKRKIAKFANGYEANFLVLGSDPIQNLLKARIAVFKVKQGEIIK
ncbi:MAG: hypothetical protein H6576_01985 [Lewinellaceae bacterium]|nr:hypothetical protein [Saprospiraceae bacterium]MCB9342439.1 hypothetical protein [Lewinellaceae bacterium]